MNNRIKELYKQALMESVDIAVNRKEYSLSEDVVVERFAELLVRECARVDSEANNIDHIDGETYNQTILQHFGVEQ